MNTPSVPGRLVPFSSDYSLVFMGLTSYRLNILYVDYPLCPEPSYCEIFVYLTGRSLDLSFNIRHNI